MYWLSQLKYVTLYTVTPRQKSPVHSEQYVGSGSLIKWGNVSSVDSKPRLYLCETCHCVGAYYWCTVHHSVLGVGQRSLCALSGQSGHLRSKSAKLSCMCLCVRKIQAALLRGMKRLGCCSMCLREAWKCNTAAVLILKQAFHHIYRTLEMHKPLKHEGKAGTKKTYIWSFKFSITISPVQGVWVLGW